MSLGILRQAVALSVRARPGLVAGHLAFVLVAGVTPVVAAWLTKLVLDRVGAGGSAAGLVLPVLGLAAAAVIAATASDTARYFAEEIGRAVRLTGQERLFDAVGRLHGIARFEDPEFLDRLHLAEGPGRQAPARMLTSALGTLQGLVTLAGFLAALLAVSVPMTGLVLLSVGPVLVAEWILARRRADVIEDNGYAARREMFFSQLLLEVRAAQEIRLFGCAAYLRALMRRESLKIAAAERRMERGEVGLQAVLAGLGAVIAAAGLWWAVTGALGGRLSVGDVTLFVAAVAGVQASAIAMVVQAATVREGALLFSHFVDVVAVRTDLPVPARPAPTPALLEGIRFHDVWFRYGDDGPWVLRGLDLWLPAGMATALVGANGAGKSTIVKLLCRLYDPCRGTITWDGVDLRELDPVELRRRIAVVFQDFMHYDLTARENIALGDLSALADQERIRAAATSARVHETLAALPQAYDTLLSRTFTSEADKDDPETGIVLSGGQWQRIALARAFLRDDAALMILDEPSSGLDAEAEHELTEELRRRRADRTSVLVSHRLGTLREAEHIVVLAEGRVAERGTHASLMAARGRYARLFELQARGYRAETPPRVPADHGTPVGASG
jgi:ATP-binding cassette, subfamily B, bacterial